MFEVILFICAVALLAVICINDFLFFRIEDSVVMGMLFCYIVILLSGYMECSILYSFSIASLFFATSAVLNHFNLIGGGDVKLLFAIGLIVSSRLFEFFCSLSLSSLIIIFAYITFKEAIERVRAYYSIKLFRYRRNDFLKRIIFPSAISVSRQEVLDEALSRRYMPSVFKQEIPYGVILSMSCISPIGSMLFVR